GGATVWLMPAPPLSFLPSPLWGGSTGRRAVGEGGLQRRAHDAPNSDPPPQPSPTRGKGARLCMRRRRSFAGLRVEHRLQGRGVMPLAEREECFLALVMREVAFQDALDRARRILCLHVLVDLATEPRVRAEAAADQHVITLDRVAVLVDGDARGEQPDVADVMLRTGMMAA